MFSDGEPNLKPFINPDTTTIKAPEGQGCPRCGGVVFAAEQQMSKGTVSGLKRRFKNYFIRILKLFRCGTRNVSTAPSVTAHSIRCWHVMALIRIFIANFAMPKISDQKVSATAMLQLSSPLMDLGIPTKCKFLIENNKKTNF